MERGSLTSRLGQYHDHCTMEKAQAKQLAYLPVVRCACQRMRQQGSS